MTNVAMLIDPSMGKASLKGEAGKGRPDRNITNEAAASDAVGRETDSAMSATNGSQEDFSQVYDKEVEQKKEKTKTQPADDVVAPVAENIPAQNEAVNVKDKAGHSGKVIDASGKIKALTMQNALKAGDAVKARLNLKSQIKNQGLNGQAVDMKQNFGDLEKSLMAMKDSANKLKQLMQQGGSLQDKGMQQAEGAEKATAQMVNVVKSDKSSKNAKIAGAVTGDQAAKAGMESSKTAAQAKTAEVPVDLSDEMMADKAAAADMKKQLSAESQQNGKAGQELAGKEAMADSSLIAEAGVKSDDKIETGSLKTETAVTVDSVRSSESVNSVDSSQTATTQPDRVSRADTLSQVIDNIKSNMSVDDKSVTVVLRPEELGKVQVRLIETDGEVSAMLQVEKPEVKDSIQRELPQVIAALNGNGIQVKKAEVVLDNNNLNSGQNSFNGAFDEAGNNGSQDSSSSSSGFGTEGSANENNGGKLESDARKNVVTDDMINVYM